MEIGQPPEGVSVYLGRHSRSSGGTKVGVVKVTFHPGWLEGVQGTEYKGEAPFDLLLLRLERAVTFSASISPVCLPNVPEDSPSPGTQVMASGWGLTKPSDQVGLLEGKGLAIELQFIWLKVISLSDCDELAVKVANDEQCTKRPDEIKNKQLTSNLTLCVVRPGNPTRGTEQGELYIYFIYHICARY